MMTSSWATSRDVVSLRPGTTRTMEDRDAPHLGRFCTHRTGPSPQGQPSLVHTLTLTHSHIHTNTYTPSHHCVCVCLVALSYSALCNLMNCSLPGSSVHRILQGRILEWVAIPFSRGSSRPRGQTHISCISCIGKQILYHWTTWEYTLTYIQTLMLTYILTCTRTHIHPLNTTNIHIHTCSHTYFNLTHVVQSLSHVRLFETPWTHQASLSFSISQSLPQFMFIQPSHPL